MKESNDSFQPKDLQRHHEGIIHSSLEEITVLKLPQYSSLAADSILVPGLIKLRASKMNLFEQPRTKSITKIFPN
jgi:hypothetical protein